ncbi:MAG: NUDIX domain-containing protein [Candidatus Aureabacteria bacterium]|nr:NUDIX domain-containing protein [Candidatus Auribacterota bacterium]
MEEEQEIFEVIDESGIFIRTATREECHSGSNLIHRAVHCFVFNDRGGLFLQKRSKTKIIQPGKWDISIGGHVLAKESFEEALIRESKEELGLLLKTSDFLYQYIWKCQRETELVRTYETTIPFKTKIVWNTNEIDDGKFWSTEEILMAIEKAPETFTPNFLYEIKRFIG